MAKGRGIIFAGLVGFAVSYLSNKENRDKALKILANAKSNVGDYINSSKVDMDANIVERVTAEVATEAGTMPTEIASNEMVAEGGGQTAVHFYNEEIQAKEK